MRVLTNELKIKRGRRTGTIFFFVSLAILTGGLLLTNLLPFSEEILVFVPCLVMPLGLASTLLSVRLTNEYVRLPRPEDALYDALEGIDKRSVMFCYFPPAPYILITRHGVYTFTIRYQMGRFAVKGDTWIDPRARNPIRRFFAFMSQDLLGDPFKDAKTHAANVQAILDRALPDAEIEVQPIVVFLSGRAEIEMTDPALPVVYSKADKKPNIKTALREDKRAKMKTEYAELSETELSAIEAGLLATLSEAELNRATELDE